MTHFYIMADNEKGFEEITEKIGRESSENLL